jgi:hypothetical protein
MIVSFHFSSLYPNSILSDTNRRAHLLQSAPLSYPRLAATIIPFHFRPCGLRSVLDTSAVPRCRIGVLGRSADDSRQQKIN